MPSQQLLEAPDAVPCLGCLRRAAFYGQTEVLLALLRAWPAERQHALDAHGNSVLHVAVLRHRHELAQALLDFGFPVMLRSGRKWAPIDEAVALRDRRMVRLLHAADVTALKAEHRAKRGDLLASMRSMPDYTFKVGCPHAFQRRACMHAVPCLHACCFATCMLACVWRVNITG